MKIVVLDGYTANPGDLSWDEFAKLGDFSVYDRTPEPETVSRLAGAEAALTNKAVINRQMMDALPALRYIGVLATGYNIVDIPAARERGIVVCNVADYSTNEVAQAVFALLLELTNRVGHHSRTVREGKWTASPDFSYWDFPLIGLAGLTFGVMGLGRTGRAVARIARAFGMKVIGNSRSAPAPNTDVPVEFVSRETVFRDSDALSLHCPLTAETARLVNASSLGMMKPTAYLINTARGGLIDEQSLADALNNGRIAGAGLDVLSAEPPRADNPLLSAKNCLITPHVAWAARSARMRLLRMAAENLRAWMEGKPRNVVNAA